MPKYVRKEIKSNKRGRKPKAAKGESKRDYLFIPPEAKGLSVKQMRFCEEYLIDLNAAQAAIRASYSKASASMSGSQLLSNLNVKRYISYLKIQRAKKLEIKAERVLEELARIAYHDKRTFYDRNNQAIPLNKITDEQQTAIKDIKFTTITEEVPVEQVDGTFQMEQRQKRIVSSYGLHNRVEALRMLGHHLGISLDKPADFSPEKEKETVSFEMLLRKLSARKLELITQILQDAQEPEERIVKPRSVNEDAFKEELEEAEKEIFGNSEYSEEHWSKKAQGLPS